MGCCGESSVETSKMALEVKSGPVLWYKRRFLGSKWRSVHTVLFNDRTLVWFSDRGRSDRQGALLVCPEFAAFGAATVQVPQGAPQLPEHYEQKQTMAFGERGKEHVQWFLCPNDDEVNSWKAALISILMPAAADQPFQQPGDPSSATPPYRQPSAPPNHPDAPPYRPPPPHYTPQYMPQGVPQQPPPYQNAIHPQRSAVLPYPNAVHPQQTTFLPHQTTVLPQSQTILLQQDSNRGGGGGGDFAMGLLAGGVLGHAWGHSWGHTPSYMGMGWGGGYGGGGGRVHYDDRDVTINNYYDNDTTTTTHNTTTNMEQSVPPVEQPDIPSIQPEYVAPIQTEYTEPVIPEHLQPIEMPVQDMQADYDYGGGDYGGGDYGGGDYGGGGYGDCDFGGGDFGDF